ncbi:MAG: phage tail protein [Betaproteobacteria bacterium HGW-Betaproteobacteria-18]|nr:MAG: phage tail protein [Betaproteobacteria bacterium HGW-Betaproteobacteria-18]
MSQHDFQTDVDDALQALASLNSGSTAPTTTYPYELWADTSSGLLKIRNGANTNWITVGTLDVQNLGLGGDSSGSGSVPAGAVMAWTTATAPQGWLECNGSAVSRTTYANLYAVLGTQYGAGDGSTTFNLPDLRGRTIIGLDNMGGSAALRVAAATSLGQAAGAETHYHTGGAHAHALANHTHVVNDFAPDVQIPRSGWGITYTTAVGALAVTSGDGYTFNPDNRDMLPFTDTVHGLGTGGGIGSSDSGGAVSTSTSSSMNPYIALNWIVKY